MTALLMTLLLMAALGFVLLPLLRTSGAARDARPDLAVYKAQLRELEQDVAAGRIDAAAAGPARLEIERRLLRAAAQDAAAPASGRASPRLALLVTGLVLVLGALYLELGRPGMPDFPAVSPVEEAGQNEEGRRIRDIIQKVTVRLEAHPEEKTGWLLLGQLESRRGNAGAAARALHKAWQLEPENFDLLLMYAEALIASAEGRITPASLFALEQADRLRPDEPGTHYYLALADYQAGRVEQALARWAKILEISPPDAPWIGQVKAVMAAARGERNPRQTAPAPNNMPVLDEDRKRVVEDMSPEDRQAMIRGMVEGLAARLADNPGDVAGWRRLARSWQVLGETEKARAALEKALEHSRESDRPTLRKELEQLDDSQ